MALPDGLTDEILDLHRTLEKLEAQYPGLARVVECRVFAGLDVNETADCLEIGTATVKRRWAMATSWMEKEISGSLHP
ncbi:MAG: ECF-type sigma factor [Bacteroidota bacterium]|nr:ECF-type sigma factor [Bacteroidota bacterium]